MRCFLLLVVACLVAPASIGHAQVAAGGGAIEPPRDVEPTPAQRAAIQAQIDASRAQLRAEGRLPSAGVQGLAAAPALEWPLAAAPGFEVFGYHGVSGFVDHDPLFPNSLEDYACGTRTYDTSGGYNHSGVDYFLWPFTWNTMDDEVVQIVAAAPGTIVWKHDGEFDRSCSLGGGLWNAVYVEHADGSVAWYGHMKNGSVTSKSVGQTVVVGEVLGLVGSSGNSTGPHLHLELHDSGGAVIDPYSGACNPVPSGWASQRPYYDSAINRLTTGWGAPVLSACDGPEITREQSVFQPGTDVFVTAWYRDQLGTQTSTYTIRRPDDSIFALWNDTPPGTAYSASFWTWQVVLPGSAPNGTWKFTVDYDGTLYEQEFEVQGPPFLPLLSLPGLAALALALGLVGAWRAGRRAG